jgi:hypothetical protein
MTTYKDPSYQDRVGRAAEAKAKALEQLRSRPPLTQRSWPNAGQQALKRRRLKRTRQPPKAASRGKAAAEAQPAAGPLRRLRPSARPGALVMRPEES